MGDSHAVEENEYPSISHSIRPRKFAHFPQLVRDSMVRKVKQHIIANERSTFVFQVYPRTTRPCLTLIETSTCLNRLQIAWKPQPSPHEPQNKVSTFIRKRPLISLQKSFVFFQFSVLKPSYYLEMVWYTAERYRFVNPEIPYYGERTMTRCRGHNKSLYFCMCYGIFNQFKMRYFLVPH